MAHPRRFRFGVQLAQASDRKDWITQVRQAADLGYGTVFMPDHFGDQLAPVPALVAAAEAADVRVGALVLDNDYRHPVVLAKEAATIDLLTEGRLELGVGAGWMRADYDWSGIPYDPAGVRIDRFEEALHVLKGAFGDGPFSFEGTHYRITDYDGQPKPVQQPHPPLLIGGGGRRILSVAARLADIVGVNFNARSGQVDQDTARSGTAEETDRKLAWIKEAAGERFTELELNVLVFMVTVTDDRRAQAEQIAPMFGLSTEQALEHPHALVGTIDQITEDLEARRERYGISYVVVQGGETMEAFSPVAERLSGN